MGYHIVRGMVLRRARHEFRYLEMRCVAIPTYMIENSFIPNAEFFLWYCYRPAE